MDDFQRKLTEESSIYQIKQILESYNGYNYNRLIDAITFRIQLTESILKGGAENVRDGQQDDRENNRNPYFEFDG